MAIDSSVVSYKNHFGSQFERHCLGDEKVVCGADTNKTVGRTGTRAARCNCLDNSHGFSHRKHLLVLIIMLERGAITISIINLSK